MKTFFIKTIKYFLIIILFFFALPITASSDLIAYWNFDDIHGWEAIDVSGNGLHAYISNALSGVAGKKILVYYLMEYIVMLQLIIVLF